MTSRRAVAYGSPVSAMRLRAASLILSCDIVPLLRWPCPGALATAKRRSRWKGKTPREGWAALVLRHYHQRRAGVARIRQTWLPRLRIRHRPPRRQRPSTALALGAETFPGKHRRWSGHWSRKVG